MIESNYAVLNRARKCDDCGKVFFTLEDIEYGEDSDDRVYRRVVSSYLLDLLYRAAMGNVVPWGWAFSFRPSSLVHHLQAILGDEIRLRQALSSKQYKIAHIASVTEFGYPLPHEGTFHTIWRLPNITLRKADVPPGT